VVLIYTLLLQKINYQKFKDIIAYLQIGFSLALFLFYQIIPRLRSDILLKEEQSLQTWLYLTPPAWFAGIINLFHTQVTPINVHLGLIGICCTGIIILFAFKKISLQYAGLIANINATTVADTPGKPKKLLFGGENIFLKLIRSFIKNPEVAAGFDLTIAMCKKDRSVKMGIYPLLGIPLAFLGLAIFEKKLQDPLIHGLFLGHAYEI